MESLMLSPTSSNWDLASLTVSALQEMESWTSQSGVTWSTPTVWSAWWTPTSPWRKALLQSGSHFLSGITSLFWLPNKVWKVLLQSGTHFLSGITSLFCSLSKSSILNNFLELLSIWQMGCRLIWINVCSDKLLEFLTCLSLFFDTLCGIKASGSDNKTM